MAIYVSLVVEPINDRFRFSFQAPGSTYFLEGNCTDFNDGADFSFFLEETGIALTVNMLLALTAIMGLAIGVPHTRGRLNMVLP